MIFRAKTSLGLDISQDMINIVILEQHEEGIKVVKAVHAAVPAGLMSEGNIVDPGGLAKLIRNTLSHNKIRTRKAAVSLVGKPVLCQILELPEELPDNVGQFIKFEIKRSPALANKEAACDYYGLGRSYNGSERVLVGAIDQEKLDSLLKTLSLAGIEPESIELNIMAGLRAIYEKKIRHKFNTNVLATYFHGSVMSICVFRKEELDFIRCIDMGNEPTDNSEFAEQCLNEIRTVVQFYDVEIEEGSDSKWEYVVVADDDKTDSEILGSFLEGGLSGQVQICNHTTVYSDTQVSKDESVKGQAGITSVGLALQSFEQQSRFGSGMDFVPPETEEFKSTKKLALITANAAAIVLLFMFILAGFVRVKLNRTQKALEEQKQSRSVNSVEQLLEHQRVVNIRTANLAQKIEVMNEIFDDATIDCWADIMDDIRSKTPTDLYITKLRCSDALQLLIEGNALSFKSIYTFAELLNESQYIEMAEVAERKRNYHTEGVVSYLIKCSLKDTRELQANAD